MHGWGNCLKYLKAKRGGTEKRGEDTKILKRGGGGKLGQGVGLLASKHPIFYGIICAASKSSTSANYD